MPGLLRPHRGLSPPPPTPGLLLSLVLKLTLAVCRPCGGRGGIRGPHTCPARLSLPTMLHAAAHKPSCVSGRVGLLPPASCPSSGIKQLVLLPPWSCLELSEQPQGKVDGDFSQGRGRQVALSEPTHKGDPGAVPSHAARLVVLGGWTEGCDVILGPLGAVALPSQAQPV